MTSIDELVDQYGSRQALWQHLFRFDGEKLFWKNPRAPRVKTGDLVGHFNSRYWSCNVCSKRVYLHKIIYEMHFGDIVCEVDHIDRDTANNRIDNLRAADRRLNVINTGLRSDNLSGVKGVSFHKATNKWCAQININGRRTSLGFFSDIKDAVTARQEAEQIRGIY